MDIHARILTLMNTTKATKSEIKSLTLRAEVLREELKTCTTAAMKTSVYTALEETLTRLDAATKSRAA